MTGIFDVADDFAQSLHPTDIQMSRAVGQGAGADFDNDSHRYTSAYSTIHYKSFRGVNKDGNLHRKHLSASGRLCRFVEDVTKRLTLAH